ncbi:membrane-associated protein, putative [Bodo saltans]|uniref:Membrane-associated protein, putative n=1 Tax=Bodo saltans TaxID=75058 RepID=A0A0S4IRH4_BODSA|nr:membrane-associated protein, putative [Bodo saltans]|eukprot:CUF35213.1 membrane-associated protein, putative [Bodo saltans]
MLRKVSSLVVVAACLLVTTVAGDSPQWKSLLKTPGPPNENGDVSLYVGPVVFDHQLFGPYVGPHGVRNSSDGAWAVSQWSNPSPITNESSLDSPVNPMCSVAGAYDASWSLSTASVRICGATASPTSSFFTPNASVVQLAQSGGSTLSCGVEYDMFLSPVDNNYPMFPQNVQPVALDDTIINIELSLKLHLEYLSISSRCSDVAHECTSSSPDYAYGTIGLPLSNPITDETIFFQILLFDSRALLSTVDHPLSPSPSKPPFCPKMDQKWPPNFSRRFSLGIRRWCSGIFLVEPRVLKNSRCSDLKDEAKMS